MLLIETSSSVTTGLCVRRMYLLLQVMLLATLPPHLAVAAGAASTSSPAAGTAVAGAVTGHPDTSGQLGRFAIDDADPSGSLPTSVEDPLQLGYLVMDLTARAEKAFDDSDFARAARYFKAMAKVGPQRSFPLQRLCAAYVAMKNLESARQSCYAALFKEGVHPIDYLRFVHLVLETRRHLLPEDVRQIDQVFAHLREQDVEQPEVYQLACDVALRLGDASRLEACTRVLAAKWPDDPKTITYEWSLALGRKDFARAESLIQRVRGTSTAPAGVREMELATATLKSRGSPSRSVLVGVALSLLFIGLLVIVHLKQIGAQSA